MSSFTVGLPNWAKYYCNFESNKNILNFLKAVGVNYTDVSVSFVEFSAYFLAVS